ncbi:MAG: hypothetical protein HFG31_06855 [Eubacterium sp.]|nr:hypothetical protein [Eubacterium sp.]
MRKKLFCIAMSMIIILSVAVHGDDKILVQNKLMEVNTADKVLKSTTFTIDKDTAKKIVKHHNKKSKLTKFEKYKKMITHLGVVSSDDDDDFVKIKERPENKSKTVGYVPDEKPVVVIESIDKWYKVKSGKITGYIKQENAVVDDEVENLLLDNYGIEALIKVSNVKLRSSAKNTNSAVGMGYKGNLYPVIGFSNDYKKIRIQRTETIEGWVSVKDVDIRILWDSAMTKTEYDAYIEEQKRIQEAELQKILNAGIHKTGDSLFDTISALIAHNESGNYVAARNGLPQFKGEKTITVGAWQWYGERAHSLLKRIYTSDAKKAKQLIEDAVSGNKKKKEEKTEALCKEITNSASWESRKRSFSKEELVAVKALLGSSNGVSIQNAQAKEDITTRMSVARNTYKLTNPQLIAYFCDMFWQNPENARNITKAAIEHFKSAKKLNEEKDGLKVLHEIAMKNSVLGKFSGRRNYTYSVCKKISKK